jgi:hypothetical protein
MKRRDFCTAAGLTLAALTLPSAGQEESTVAEFDLYEVLEDDTLNETEVVVGWISANITDAGLLVVDVHLDQGDPLTWFDVLVEVNHEIHEGDLAWLLTDDQGVGETQVAAHLADYPEDPADPDDVQIQVVISWAVED